MSKNSVGHCGETGVRNCGSGCELYFLHRCWLIKVQETKPVYVLNLAYDVERVYQCPFGF